ncbi:MAG: hypothetical protein HY336_01720 [Candidatus Doudnabacteria bacterium]|nr:hypothetical protein [Candidatus Doudnabacteria bacterium]
MDIIRKIKPLKASFEKLTHPQKLVLVLVLISLVTLLIPHQSFAALGRNEKQQPLVFVIGDHLDFIAAANKQAKSDYQTRKLEQELMRKQKLAKKVAAYLGSYGSPLSAYSSDLIELKNWKKILALANAESSFCRKYPASKANCWGVGGASLWDFGDDLGQGIKAMDKFLNAYPKRSNIKYSSMPFDRMNGLYKQPAADHWVQNTQGVYNDLTQIEKSV